MNMAMILLMRMKKQSKFQKHGISIQKSEIQNLQSKIQFVL